MRRYWQASWPARWLATARWLLRRVRIHPSATLAARTAQLHLAPGVRLGSGCVVRAIGDATVVLKKGVWFARDVEVETATRVSIGRGTTVQRRCTINGSTRIGAGCILAPDVFISSGTHPFRDIPHLPIREQERRLAGATRDRPVWVQDDCWIGTHAVICPGVTIGKGSVVGANSVVTRDVPPYSVVAGAPARKVGTRLAWEPPDRVDATVETDWPYVLAGMLQSDAAGCPAGVVLSAQEPVVVVLQQSAPGAVARIRLRHPAEGMIVVNGQTFALEGAGEALLVPAGPPHALGTVLDIMLFAPASTPIVFTAFELVEQPRPTRCKP